MLKLRPYNRHIPQQIQYILDTAFFDTYSSNYVGNTPAAEFKFVKFLPNGRTIVVILWERNDGSIVLVHKHFFYLGNDSNRATPILSEDIFWLLDDEEDKVKFLYLMSLWGLNPGESLK